MIEVMTDTHSATWESGAPFWMRQIYNVVRLAVFEKLPDRPAADKSNLPPVFDNLNSPWAMKYRKPFYKISGKTLKFKGYATKLKPEDRKGICTHQTAVEFGTSSSRRKFWRKVIDQEPDLLIASGFQVPEDEDGKQKLAERMALHERFWTVPYHVVILLNGDILLNNDFLSYTWHGNKSNKSYIGVAIEGHFPGLEKSRTSAHTSLTDRQIEVCRYGYITAIDAARAQGCPMTDLTSHRVFSAGRAGDIGEKCWKQVALPVLEKYDLSVDYSLQVGSGRPIPLEWDPNALYLWNGKRA